MNWHELPFLRLLVPLSAGIITNFFLELGDVTVVALCALAGLGSIMLVVHRLKVNFRFRWVYGVWVNLWFYVLGIQMGIVQNELNHPNHFKNYLKEQNYILGEIKEIKSHKKSKQLVIKVLRISDEGKYLKKATGKLSINVLLQSTHLPALNDANFGLKDTIFFKGCVKEIALPKNKRAFDFKKFMQIRNIHYQTFVKIQDLQSPISTCGEEKVPLLEQIKSYCSDILVKHLGDGEEIGVATALVLGQKQFLTEEIKNAYGNTGAMHVLAVSGLHVGFVHIGLSFLLNLLGGERLFSSYGKTLIELIGIWLYALITGLSPSVLRASVMFSFFAIGKSIRRDTNVFNILAASAFFLLIFNSNMLFDPGFQLSYLAMMGILVLYPKIYSLISIRYWFLDYLWKLLAVALAAQVFTLPVGLYYFHQFPVYFWLSGFFVVPAAGVVLSLGLFLIIISKVTIIAFGAGILLSFILKAMNFVIIFIEKLPYSIIEGIWISWEQCILLYIILVLIILVLQFRNKKLLFLALGLIGWLILEHDFKQIRQHQQKMLVFYHIPKTGVIDLVAGKQAYSVTYGKPLSPYLKTVVQNSRSYYGINLINTICSEADRAPDEMAPKKRPKVIRFGNKKVLLLNQRLEHQVDCGERFDIVILGENCMKNFDWVCDDWKPSVLFIIDTSNNYYVASKLEKLAKVKGIKCINIYEAGDFEYAL